MASAAVESNGKDTSLGDSYDQTYEDDFEKDSSVEEKPTQNSSPFKATEKKTDDDEEDRNNNVKSPTEDPKSDTTSSQEQHQQHHHHHHQQQQQVNGKQEEADTGVRKTPVSRDPHRPGGDVEAPSDNDSEPEDTYNFTDDQRRAMMELIVQKQEDVDLLDEEPPEYDVRDRLVLLNAELANEPSPEKGQREARVGFKSEIVDLVAPPPPDFSDEDSRPNSARGEPQPSFVAPVGGGKSEETVDNAKKGNSDNSDDSNKKVVVERDGRFELLNVNDLTADERALYIPEESKEKTEKKTQKQTQKTKDSKSSEVHQPRPPARPRPNTAATTSGTRRQVVRPSHSPRPKSAGHINTSTSSSNSSLDNFNYNSPYAMTPEQKEHSREMARKMEEERREKDRRKQDESEDRKKQSESAFRAWLDAKREERRRQQQQQHNDEEQKSEQERPSQTRGVKPRAKKQTTNSATGTGKEKSSAASLDSFDVIYPYLLATGSPKEEREAAFKGWVKEKRQQGKKEKLLKRRQQQEQMEGFYIRPREDCEKAYKEWLKKKNADFRRQQDVERQRNRMYRVQMKRSRKTNMLLKALKESNSFRYVDYYGYR